MSIATTFGPFAIAAALAGVACAAVAAEPAALKLQTVSAPADKVSGDQILVRVSGPGADRARLNLDGRDVTATLVVVSAGVREGLVSGLTPGAHTLAARTSTGRSASLAITDWPLDGPIFSGPRQTPFICQTADFKLPDGQALGPSTAPTCFAPTQISWLYKPRGEATLKPLADPTHAPADIDQATTVEGAHVPFVVRVETGVIDRSIYQFAVLADPASGDTLSAAHPLAGWNRRLIALHGTGCVRGWYIQGSALGANVLDVDRLGDGYALFASTLNHPTNSCNAVLAAEVTMMVKQRVVDSLGAPLYTLSMGSSGGAYTSLQVADAYPGLIDGVLIGAVFPDALAIAETGLDGHLLNHFFAVTAPGAFTPAQQQAIGGYGSPMGLLANGNQAGRTDPVQGRADVQNYASAVWNPAVPEALRYDPKTNPKGARPTVFDAAVNVYGRDPATGFARRPFDNVGVQYGLAALNAGTISTAQFLDLNAGIGGVDADDNYTAARTTGDATAIANAYASGLMLSGGGALTTLPVFDFGGLYTDLAPGGEYHMRFHHFSVRERIAGWNGGAANTVMWGGGPGLGAHGLSTDPADVALTGAQGRESFRLMQAWMTALAKDPTPASLQKTVRDRPSGLTDGCWTRETTPRFIAERQVHDGDTECNRRFPPFAFPRLVAGGPLSDNVLKCALKAPDPADYKVSFTPQEWARLKTIFATGVCDWRRPGQGQARVKVWSRYGP